MKHLSVHKYIQDVGVNRAKGRNFPTLRGQILPSHDWQIHPKGLAINWLGIRIRFSLPFTKNFK